MNRIRPIDPGDKAEWLRMREALWPAPWDEHESEIDGFFDSATGEMVVLVAPRETGGLGGFLEVGTRPYAEGCASSPVGYIEGWWVDPDLRRTGVGAQLVVAAEDWARSQGLTEMASDSELANDLGQRAHRSVGYDEVERIVCFRKSL